MGIEVQVNRERMLKRLHATWIEDVLEQQWLQDAVLLSPDLHDLPSAVSDPWQSIMQEKKQPERPYPKGTTIIDVYDKADGELLILGEPGSGKTALLLVLMRELIKRARQHESHPLPVYVHLASWARKRLPLAAWLVEELQDKYQVSSPVASNWVNTQQVMPLLDGLDTLAPDMLPACVNAINAYRQEYDAVPMVVCCRSADYLRQQARLILPRAAVIQPLTGPQIDLYLRSAGKLDALQTAFMQDESLRRLAATPLLLSILTQLDQQMLARNLEENDIETPREAIFAAYIESMLARGAKNELSSPVQTKQWLGWLARQMEEHHQILFNPAHIQPDWLTAKWATTLYYLVNGLSGVLLCGTALGLAGDIAGSQLAGIVAGLAGALVGGIGFAFAASSIRPVETVQRSSVKRHIRSLLYVLVLWLLVLLTNQSGSLSGTFITIVAVLSLPLLLIGELLRELPAARLDDRTTVPPGYGLRQSARSGLRIGLLAGMGFGLLVVLFQLSGLLKAHFINYWLLALLLGLFSGLLFGGLAALQLKGLYWLLWRSGSVPGTYLEFLDYAAKHLFLSKTGSGYMFRYPLLQDYFAALPPEQDRAE